MPSQAVKRVRYFPRVPMSPFWPQKMMASFFFYEDLVKFLLHMTTWQVKCIALDGYLLAAQTRTGPDLVPLTKSWMTSHLINLGCFFFSSTDGRRFKSPTRWLHTCSLRTLHFSAWKDSSEKWNKQRPCVKNITCSCVKSYGFNYFTFHQLCAFRFTS